MFSGLAYYPSTFLPGEHCAPILELESYSLGCSFFAYNGKLPAYT